MRTPISLPLLVRNIKVKGPKGIIRVDLVLDTGAAFVALPWSILKTIGYDPAAVPERQEIITANGVIEVPKLQVDTIAAGDAEVRDVEVICHDIPELAGVRGLFGLSFLKHFRTVIDYRTGYLEIS